MLGEFTASVEAQVFVLLTNADSSYRYSDGQPRWLLDAEDVVYLLQLGKADPCAIKRVSKLLNP
jgi:hypothetical protein